MKKHLIAGIGFTESYWAEHLILEGHEVVVSDNILSKFKENLDGLSMRFIERDIRDVEFVEEFDKDCHCVFHLEALVNISI